MPKAMYHWIKLYIEQDGLQLELEKGGLERTSSYQHKGILVYRGYT